MGVVVDEDFEGGELVFSPLIEALDVVDVGDDVEFVVVGKGGLVYAEYGEFSCAESIVGGELDGV